jgi:hypothetical protein
MGDAFDVLVLGGGAAGLMCAIEAGKRGRKVGVLERAEQIGKKILISGGGRCNFTHLNCRPDNFLSRNPHFCKSALARYLPSDFVALVEKHRISYHEKTKGQLFCNGSAREIVSMLEEECRRAGVAIRTGVRIAEVRRGDQFVVISGAEQYRSTALVVATGGLSIPKIGATSFGYDLARQFGLKMEPCRPALVPLTFRAEERAQFANLAGVATSVRVSCDGQSFEDKMLFTHRGLSGPAILQISSYWKPGERLHLDLAPGKTALASLRSSPTRRDRTAAKRELQSVLPQRLAERWLEIQGPADWTNASLAKLEDSLHRWEWLPADTEGYEKAEVTAGGVSTEELSARTMECKRVSGLYFVGEVLDVTGQLGGYNFQWAWASGFCAGQAV